MNEPSFPRLYTAHMDQFREDLPLWTDLATSSGSPILELGCGSGRVVFDLAKKGFIVTGLDNNIGMIRWARSQMPPNLQEYVNLVHADMRHFALDDQYNLVLIPCNTFAYFNKQDAHQVLRCVKNHLASNGKLAIVIPNPEECAFYPTKQSFKGEGKAESIHDFIEPKCRNPVQVYAYEDFHEENNTIEVNWFFDELLPNGRVKRIQHDVTYHLRSLDETLDLLKIASLDIRNVYGDYQRGSLKRTSDEIILLAENTTNS